jgi:hypothetical protein
MNETTETIVQKNPPGPGKKMWELVTETGEKYKAFGSEADHFHAGKRYRFSFESKEFNGYPFKSIKGAPKPVGSEVLSSANGARPSDIGPHVGMWEKNVFEALLAGKTSSEVIIMGIEARLAAREIVRTDLDGKLPEPVDLNDSLEF